jgi:tetratricopeptide (TPR) repeat protein/serine/threonine protein kinase
MQEQAIFIEALEKEDHAERVAFLDRACAGDAALRERIERLLQRHAQADSFLESRAPGADTTAPGGGALAAAGESAGSVIGPYKLLQQIGEGGMGTVWMAQQTEPVKRLVALKLIKAGMDSKQVLARFEAERQALALMDHPHIARVLDAGATATGGPFFVMELVKGVPLTKYCDEHHLTPKERLELFVPVCQAIQHAHQKGIIHRDIKPSNVLIALYDGKPVPKVIDFGIAKAAGQQLTEKTLVTGFGAIVGTLEYMSPEQAELNQLDIDTRSDVYSLGVLLYELLTGTTPLEKKRLKQAAVLEVLRIIREEEPPRPSTRLSATDELPGIAAKRGLEPKKLSGLVRGELDWIVMKALEKDRNRRYETANAFARDVQRYLADEPVQACPPSAWYRFRKFTRRNKGRLAAAVGVSLAVTVMAASFGWAVRDRAAREAEIGRAEVARRTTVAGKVRDSVKDARTLIAGNKLAPAREKLAEARGQLGNDRAVLGNLAAEIETGEAELDRFQQFLDLIERAREAETAPLLEPVLAPDDPPGSAGTQPAVRPWERRRATAATFLLQALARYEILQRDDWNTTLKGGLLGRDRVEQIRRLAYEELLWLADDVVRRQQEHRLGKKLTPEAAARQALVYLGKAESAHRPARALYALRAHCRKAIGEEKAARADRQLADKTPPTAAQDHYLRGQAAYHANQLAQGTQAFEAALRLEPTHYWSLLWLGYGLCELGKGPEDFAGAARVFTGCILKRPEHAHAYYCRGNAYLKLLSQEEAVADFSRSLELDPNSAQPWINRGVAYRNLGKLKKAVADFSRAIQLDRNHAFAWNNRAAVYKELGQPEKALRDYSRAVELDTKYAKAWGGRGSVYLDLGQPKQALADLTRALDLEPKDAITWYNRGHTYSDLRQWKEAIADFSKAIELNSRYAKAWCMRGAAYLDLGQPEKTVADCSRAIDLDENNPTFWANRGIAYFRLGQLDNAAADYSKAIHLNPKLARAWNNRGNAYLRLGQSEKGISDLTQAIKLDPKAASYWFDRAAAYTRLRQPKKALPDLTQTITLDPNNASAWNSRGATYGDLGQHDKAIGDLTEAIKLNRKLAQAWNNRGISYLQLGEPARAVADCSEAINLKTTYVKAWAIRGLARLQLGEPDRAVIDFSQVITLAPDRRQQAGGHLLRARAHRQQARFPEALADYQRVLELRPADLGGHNELAWLLATCPDSKLRDPDRAVKLAGKAVELSPKNGGVWNTLGVAHYRAGDHKAAVAALLKSRDLRRGGDASDSLFLAMAYGKLGDHEQARKAYGEAVGWIEKNKQALEKDRLQAEELRRFRSEAEDVLELTKK